MRINIFLPKRDTLITKIKKVILISSFISLNACSAQIPSLGDVRNFALFTNSGAFNNTGYSNIVGDIGTQVGAYTGFPPGTLNGNSNIADTTSVRIATLVSSLYTAFSSLTADSTLGVGLGSNQVLTAKIYALGGASTLNGNLVLDAQGDSNAIFIFKINGALTTSTSCSVTLINSASTKNVYWLINGLFNLANSSVFKGTMLVNGAITINNGSILEGRALTIAGAIEIDNILADTTSLMYALPIKLTSFQVTCSEGKSILKWSTASELNNDYYILYRSIEGKIWEPVSKILGSGNSLSIKNYSVIDYAPFPNISYYKLLQMDFNGNSEYSAIVWINSCSKKNIQILLYPNPTQNIVNFKSPSKFPEEYTLSIFNSNGVLIYISDIYKANIDLSKFESGTYTLLTKIDGKNTMQEIVLSK